MLYGCSNNFNFPFTGRGGSVREINLDVFTRNLPDDNFRNTWKLEPNISQRGSTCLNNSQNLNFLISQDLPQQSFQGEFTNTPITAGRSTINKANFENFFDSNITINEFEFRNKNLGNIDFPPNGNTYNLNKLTFNNCDTDINIEDNLTFVNTNSELQIINTNTTRAFIEKFTTNNNNNNKITKFDILKINSDINNFNGKLMIFNFTSTGTTLSPASSDTNYLIFKNPIELTATNTNINNITTLKIVNSNSFPIFNLKGNVIYNYTNLILQNSDVQLEHDTNTNTNNNLKIKSGGENTFEYTNSSPTTNPPDPPRLTFQSFNSPIIVYGKTNKTTTSDINLIEISNKTIDFNPISFNTLLIDSCGPITLSNLTFNTSTSVSPSTLTDQFIIKSSHSSTNINFNTISSSDRATLNKLKIVLTDNVTITNFVGSDSLDLEITGTTLANATLNINHGEDETSFNETSFNDITINNNSGTITINGNITGNITITNNSNTITINGNITGNITINNSNGTINMPTTITGRLIILNPPNTSISNLLTINSLERINCDDSCGDDFGLDIDYDSKPYSISIPSLISVNKVKIKNFNSAFSYLDLRLLNSPLEFHENTVLYSLDIRSLPSLSITHAIDADGASTFAIGKVISIGFSETIDVQIVCNNNIVFTPGYIILKSDLEIINEPDVIIDDTAIINYICGSDCSAPFTNGTTPLITCPTTLAPTTTTVATTTTTVAPTTTSLTTTFSPTTTATTLAPADIDPPTTTSQ